MRLLDGLVARVGDTAHDIVERRLRNIEAELADLPGIAVRQQGDTLVISGRGLVRRWVDDMRLRLALWNGR